VCSSECTCVSMEECSFVLVCAFVGRGCANVHVCVCVRARERQREREKNLQPEWQLKIVMNQIIA